MQSLLKRIAILTLCFVMVFQMTGCDTENNTQDITEYCSVWSASSSVKIAQDDTDYDNKGAAELVYNTVKNEYESCQLLLTATADIGEYYLESSDLTDGTNVLSKDNFTVYMQRYVTAADSYGTWTLPDALIPEQSALDYGEMTVANGKNAGLWVTVYVPAETAAGVYEGTFKLTVEDATMDIPVKVTVNDYVLPETTSGQTLFSWRYDRVGAGELDSSVEMMEEYYEFFLDYRVSLESLPLESNTREEVVDALETYYDKLTTYTIIPEPGEVPGGNTLGQKSKTLEMIYAIASISSAEKNYFDKAMLYVVDEPDLTLEDKRTYTISTCASVNAMLQEAVDTIAADTSGDYDSFKAIDGWEDSIKNIPNIIPLTETSAAWLVTEAKKSTEAAIAVLEAINTVCPTFDVYETLADELLELCETYNIENIWWYGCTGPKSPYGNYHIGDTNLLSPRTNSWLQAKYGIEGNLYWDAAAYTDEAALYSDQYINVYEYPFRNSSSDWPAGDGFLAYPGAAYGIYGPLPSMRLMALRDGMEELEMLLALKELYAKNADIDAQAAIDNYANAVSNSAAQLYADGENGLDFATQRNNLISDLVSAAGGTSVVLQEISVKGKKASVSYYVPDDCTVYIDGEAQEAANGNIYEYIMDLEENTTLDIVVEAADGTTQTISKFIGNPTTILQSFDDAASLEHITVSEGGAVALSSEIATDGSSAQIKVVGKVTGDELIDAAYVPSAKLAVAGLNEIENLSQVNVLSFDVYNVSEEDFKMTLKIYNGKSFATLGEYNITPGKNTISVSVSNLNFSGLEEADTIAFEFNNTTDGVNANEYEFYLDNMIAKD